MKKNATRNILNRLALCMALTLAFTFALLPQVKAKAAGNEASVTRASETTGTSETKEYATLKAAFANAENGCVIKLLSDVTIASGESLTLNSAVANMSIDLNGKTLTLNGTLNGGEEDEEYPQYSPGITIESTIPGTFICSGKIQAALSTWTGDTFVFEPGTEMGKQLGIESATVKIKGGAFTGGLFTNNGGAADLDLTISGSACLSNMGNSRFVMYTPGSGTSIHLTLSGGYYDEDPRLFYMTEGSTSDTLADIYGHVSEVYDGYTYYVKSGNNYTKIALSDITNENLEMSSTEDGSIFYCYRDFVTVDESKIEEYNNQADWTADPAVYKWRIKDENAADVPVTEISLSKAELNLTIGASETLQAKVLPVNATGASVVWKSDTPSVAEVKDGVVTAKAAGKAVITATAGGKSANCLVTVTAKDSGSADKPGEVISGQKKDNPVTFKAKKLTLKQKDLKKKAKSFALDKYITSTDPKGAVTCKLVSAKLKKKNAKKSFKLNAKTGKLTVKKGTKKGTYKLTFTVKAAGDDQYKAAEQNITVTVKVK